MLNQLRQVTDTCIMMIFVTGHNHKSEWNWPETANRTTVKVDTQFEVQLVVYATITHWT